MIEEILPNLYRIEVPLPRNPLQAVNSYVIKAKGQSLIIDTGMNRRECMDVMSSGLKELNVDLKKADFLLPICTQTIWVWFQILPQILDNLRERYKGKYRSKG